MHYSEIEMAESMSASTKISARNLVCRLCGGYMLYAICFEYASRPAYLKICI